MSLWVNVPPGVCRLSGLAELRPLASVQKQGQRVGKCEIAEQSGALPERASKNSMVPEAAGSCSSPARRPRSFLLALL